MIVERNTFYAKYGQGDALLDVIRGFIREFGAEVGMTSPRVYTDVTGPMFQIMWEQEFPDLTAFTEMTKAEAAMFGDTRFQQWFAKMQPLVEKGERQLLNVVEI